MDNSKFGNRPYDGKTRLSCQLKFFGAKKQGFISVYAKKPRILVKVKAESKYNWLGGSGNGVLRGGQSPMQALMQARESELYRQQAGLGIQNTAHGHALRVQMQVINAAQQMQRNVFNNNDMNSTQQGFGQASTGDLMLGLIGQ